MRHIMTFHPEWGCLAPVPSFMRTARTVLAATAVGATAGSGVVFALVDHSARDQTSVAERTLVRPIAAAPTSVSAAQTAKLSPQGSDQRETRQVSWAYGHTKDSATIELNANSPARPTIVAASDEVRAPTDGDPARTAVAPSPILRANQKHIAQRARYKDVRRSLRQPQHSLPARIEPNAFQRILAGLAAAVDHAWSLTTSIADPTSQAHSKSASAANS